MLPTATNFVWHYSDSKGGRLLVMLALARYADNQGYCHSSIDAIANLARVGRRQARRLLKELSEDGEILIIHNAGAKTKSGLTNAYWLQKYRQWVGLDLATSATVLPNNDNTEISGNDYLSTDEGAHRPPLDSSEGGTHRPPLDGEAGTQKPPLEAEGGTHRPPNTMFISSGGNGGGTSDNPAHEAGICSLRSKKAQPSEYELKILEWAGQHAFWSDIITSVAALRRNLNKPDSALLKQYNQAVKSTDNGAIQNERNSSDHEQAKPTRSNKAKAGKSKGRSSIWDEFKQQRNY